MDFLLGITEADWIELVMENGFALESRYWRRYAHLTMLAAFNSTWRRQDEDRFGEAVRRTEIPPPLFILGHWRSGTSLLQRLLAVDSRYAYPTSFEVVNPHTFLIREDRLSERLSRLPDRKRPMDEMILGFNSPGEDEMAVSLMSLRSPELGLSFPRRQEHYDRYLTFEGVPEADVARFRGAFLHFLRKLVYRYRRPLILKSPEHTGRLRLLLTWFPQARFVHIIRNPYVVYQSMVHLYDKTLPGRVLQTPPPGSTEAGILRRYRLMYDAYLEQRSEVPAGQLCEVRFEDLERDKAGQVERVYRELNLPRFEAVKPRLAEFVGSLGGYRRNRYEDLPETVREKIADAWGRSFQAWDYAV